MSPPTYLIIDLFTRHIDCTVLFSNFPDVCQEVLTGKYMKVKDQISNVFMMDGSFASAGECFSAVLQAHPDVHMAEYYAPNPEFVE